MATTLFAGLIILPAYMFVRIARSFMKARGGIVRQSRSDISSGISTFDAVLVIAVVGMLGGFMLAFVPDLGWVGRGIVIAAPATFLGLVVWSRWQLRQVEREMFAQRSFSASEAR